MPWNALAWITPARGTGRRKQGQEDLGQRAGQVAEHGMFSHALVTFEPRAGCRQPHGVIYSLGELQHETMHAYAMTVHKVGGI